MTTPAPIEELERLKALLASWGGCAVGFSGGVDSTFLITVAHEVLGSRCLAVIATSSTHPAREYAQALAWVSERGIPYVVIRSAELKIAGFADNPPDRCYTCKHELFRKVRTEAHRFGVSVVADGANADDPDDFRPGMRAAQELGVRSPLMECGLSKTDIRTLSREVYDLPTADRQSMACLAFRIPYGARITAAKLEQIENIEDFLAGQGFPGLPRAASRRPAPAGGRQGRDAAAPGGGSGRRGDRPRQRPGVRLHYPCSAGLPLRQHEWGASRRRNACALMTTARLMDIREREDERP